MNPGNKQLTEIYFQPVHKTFLGKTQVQLLKKQFYNSAEYEFR